MGVVTRGNGGVGVGCEMGVGATARVTSGATSKVSSLENVRTRTREERKAMGDSSTSVVAGHAGIRKPAKRKALASNAEAQNVKNTRRRVSDKKEKTTVDDLPVRRTSCLRTTTRTAPLSSFVYFFDSVTCPAPYASHRTQLMIPLSTPTVGPRLGSHLRPPRVRLKAERVLRRHAHVRPLPSFSHEPRNVELLFRDKTDDRISMLPLEVFSFPLMHSPNPSPI